VLAKKIFFDQHHPARCYREASQHFWMARAAPPRLRRGIFWPHLKTSTSRETRIPRYRLVMDQSFDVFTMGFSNRTWDETIRILQIHEIRRLVDIRTLPGSRRTPQFNLENLQQSLPEHGIDYVHMKSLGGLRKPLKDSTLNAAWRNDGFRGYADYMQSSGFEESLQTLIKLMKEQRTVYVCTEAVFWRCHRQLVSDALLIRGYQVGHILGVNEAQPHKLTPHARVEGERLTYPALL